MTIAEYTALVLLARTCRDHALMRRVLALVPDLVEVVDPLPEPTVVGNVRQFPAPSPISHRDGE